MNRQNLAWLGWVILVFSATMVIVSLTLFVWSGQFNGVNVALLLSFLAFPTVGAIVVSQRQTNTIGWLFCLAGVGTAATSFSAAYIQLALALHTDGSLLTGVIDLIGGLVWPMNLTLGVLLLYLFPDGRALSPRWRLIVWALLLILLWMTIVQAIAPGPLETNGRVPNPLGVPALASISTVSLDIAHQLIMGFVLLAVLSLIVRYRRAEPIERQRIKWFVFGAAVMVIFVTAGSVASFLISNDPNNIVSQAVSSTTFALGILALPLGVGVGILRYRLYDIDILINRTLVYGSLTAILAALYFGLVIGAQLLTRQFTGQQAAQQPPLVIVLSTLLIAALFQPLRARLQRTIDRRFYRSRYDAARTLAAFSATLQQEVNLTQLNDHLLKVVEETMRPTQVSLWLRDPKRPNASTRER